MNLEAMKAAFRAAAIERGIDPVEGATIYQAANVKAEQSKRTYCERQQEAVYANAETHTPLDTYQMHEQVLIGERRWSAVPHLKTYHYGHWDNGSGYVDQVKVEHQASPEWWVNESYWLGGGRLITIRVPETPDVEDIVSHLPPPDAEAIYNLREESLRREGREEEGREQQYTSKLEATREAWMEAKAEASMLSIYREGESRKRRKIGVIDTAETVVLARVYRGVLAAMS